MHKFQRTSHPTWCRPQGTIQGFLRARPPEAPQSAAVLSLIAGTNITLQYNTRDGGIHI